MDYHIGIDIGSISVNTVIINQEKEIVAEYYDFSHGQPYITLLNRLREIKEKYPTNKGAISCTGSGGKLAASLLNGEFVNEIIAQSKSVSVLYPHVKTVIEMGGEDSKLIFMEENQANGNSRLSDFAMNNLCAAGTGSFLDQQAKRVGVSIQDEFGKLALKSEKPPRIAGRCSVFAKSDMIHLQQVATPVHDIIAGLCFAVARNFKSTLGRGKTLEKPIMFQGGVAANEGVVKAFTEIYDLEDGELIIPMHYASMGAIGSVYHSIEELSEVTELNLDKLSGYITGGKGDSKRIKPLKDTGYVINKETTPITSNEVVDAYLGIDIGSLSTNIAIIDKDNNVLARRYLPTASKPLVAIQKGLAEIKEEIGDKIKICAVGTTGSGRYLVGDFVGADTIQNEITAQATAAIAFDDEVDTIFEIGGQDSKYISIKDGVIVEFEMNKVCAAGTGSFLEEQADKLGINIKEEFGDRGLSSKEPVKLGERCTVFMESDLNSHQQKGLPLNDLIAGLAYSTVSNYLNRVVRDKPIGNKINFQGGVTNNRAVVAAFEAVTGKKINVPPHFDITGAIGTAILAKNEINGKATNFRGFDVSNIEYETDSFICKSCSNDCEIKRVRVEGQKKPLLYGGICDKYEIDSRKKKIDHIPDLFEEREQILLEGFVNEFDPSKTTIGIPKGLMNYYQLFPFWNTFFKELGFNVVLSDETNQEIVTRSLETMVSETCLPVEVMHGHVLNLIDKNVDYVFLPFVVNAKADKDNPTNNCNCPWVQSHPYLLKAAFTDEKIREKLLVPALHFRYFDKVLKKELQDFFGDKFGLNKKKIADAINKANSNQELAEQKIKEKGKEVLADLGKYKKAMVILGRPYNTGDPELNLRLVKKLIKLEVLPIPVDFLPLDIDAVFKDYPNMYWPNGQKIVAAAKYISNNDKLSAVYLGNFRCGPDSFILHFVKKELKSKPFLHLEVDEHSADAGLITRCEAFLDSLSGYEKHKKNIDVEIVERKNGHVRTLYYPYARDTVHVMSAATRYCGVPSEVLPMADEVDIELGRKYTNGQECFPAIVTTGSFIKKLLDPKTDPRKSSFFMPDHNGPCRFGEYNHLQRIIFDDLGFKDAEIMRPSNEDSYASLIPGKSIPWRKVVWKGIVATDLQRKMLEETRPYEVNKGETDKVYQEGLQSIIKSLETGAKDLPDVLEKISQRFAKIEVDKSIKKPVIAIVGEVFMRDNPFCSNFLVKRLEDLGAETLMAPFGEWINYSTVRFLRDSKWKRDIKGIFKSKIQHIFQKTVENKLKKSVADMLSFHDEITVEEMLDSCGEYIHRDYDGDPPLAIGSAKLLAEKHISGVVNILPFTCLPGTINCTVSHNFKKDHGGLPWENFAYDGNENIGISTRFEAFMHQAKEYHQKMYEKQKV